MKKDELRFFMVVEEKNNQNLNWVRQTIVGTLGPSCI